MTTRLPHYLEVLKDRREQLAQRKIITQLQIQELDLEIAKIQSEDAEDAER
jgi:hypothetical protein